MKYKSYRIIEFIKRNIINILIIILIIYFREI